MAFEVVFTTDAAERLEKTANYLQYTCQSPKPASELYLIIQGVFLGGSGRLSVI